VSVALQSGPCSDKTYLGNVNKILGILGALSGEVGYYAFKVKNVCGVAPDQQSHQGEEHSDTTCRAE